VSLSFEAAVRIIASDRSIEICERNFFMPYITINTCRFYYEERGQGDALVLIHGLGSSTRDWEVQVDAFAPTFRVITFDLRGHGRSDKPAGPYTIPLFAADIIGLFKGLNIEQAHLVGISLGGAIAFQCALDHPEMLKTLTIVNSAPLLGLNDQEARQEIDRRVGIVQQMGMQAMGQSLAPGLFPKPEHAALRGAFIERWAANDPAAYIAATRAMAGWNVLNQISTIHCPTLILTADQDYSPVSVKEAYTKLMPNARLVVLPDAHHAAPMETPVQFNAALRTFLKEPHS
jgi:pimeloyl-ACP methyl ester carboxylesterase